ncbi:hypothetical protein NSQ61_02985 [Aeribacillus sp. FSL K6-1121]|uniref:hypothetical protein n=1 Tax=Aeribacillus sp. FSL K6-1121 TaxID=2954745 RepID=UPI0030FB0AEB
METNNYVKLRTEKGEITLSDNPYYYSDAVTIKTDDITINMPLQRFIRHLIFIFGYDKVKSAVDNFPQELRYKRGGAE